MSIGVVPLCFSMTAVGILLYDPSSFLKYLFCLKVSGLIFDSVIPVPLFPTAQLWTPYATSGPSVRKSRLIHSAVVGPTVEAVILASDFNATSPFAAALAM